MSCVLTQFGEGFYPASPSEFVRFSLTTRSHSKPDCHVEVAEGVRPPLPEPPEEPESQPQAEEPQQVQFISKFRCF